MRPSDRYPLVLLVAFLAIFAALGVAPWYRQDWLLENLLVFVAVPGLVLTYHRLRFSNFAYTCLFVFFVLHEIGAHNVPTILVYNKIDVIGRAPSVERDSRDNIVAVSVSAKTGQGLDLLRDAIVKYAQRAREAAHPESSPAWTPAAVV